METPIQIDFQGMSANPDIRAAVEKRIDELETRFGRITAGRVAVKGPGGHHKTGGLYEINIRLLLPNAREVNVARTAKADERYADLNFAINDTFKRARRQLQDRVRRMQGQVKRHEPTPAGTVLRIDPSQEFGFIGTPDGREVYFHRNAVLDDAFGDLGPGVRVAFAEEDGIKGPQASSVRLLGKHLVP